MPRVVRVAHGHAHLDAVGVDLVGDLQKPLFLDTGWEPTLRQCYKTSQIFTGTERIFASGDRGEDAIFHRFVFEGKRDFWLFGRPQPSEKTNRFKMTSPPTKICEEP